MARLDKKDVPRMAKQMDVRFIRPLFSNISGFLKGFAIAVHELIRRILGNHVFSEFIDNKKIEWDRYQAQVTDYELNEYFSIL